MFDKTTGFVGAGQMGGALIKGIIGAGLALPETIWISDANPQVTAKLKSDFGVNVVANNEDVVVRSDVIVLAVKPQHLLEIVTGLTGSFSFDKVIVSIAAGMTTANIAAVIGKPVRLVRVMPNSPALVGMGISVVSPGEGADREAVEIAKELFSSVGEVVELPEEFQDRVTAISGSGPAYFYYLVEALTEAAVDIGVPAETATKLVAQTAAGSAAMLSRTGRSPGELRAMVTSPGGTTQAAIESFESAGFRRTIREGVKAAVRRAKELAK